MSQLSAIGIDADSEALYRRVLRHDRRPLGDHATALDWTPDRAERARQSAVTEGLIEATTADGLERTDVEVLVAGDPRGVIGRIVQRQADELDGRRRALDGVRAVVDELAADHRAARQGDQHGPSSPATDVIAAGAEPSVVAQLLRTTTGVLRSMHLEVASGPGADPQVYGLARRMVAQGRELRSVYPSSVLDQPAGLEWMVTWAAVGENQRLADAVPHEFVVFGAEAVVALPHWGRTGGGAVVIRQPVAVQAFTRVFDDAWSRGVVLPGAAGGSQSAAQLLNLLAAGFKDEAIARALGVGVRTVRRRIAETIAELGVHTRFQLGAAAERRSLLAAAPD